jgi:hypothetical protein
MTFSQRREQARRLRDLPLAAVLARCGAEPDRSDPRKWRTPAGTLSVTGAKFMNWNLGTGGGGAIDLVIHLNHLNFKEAVDWLARHFPDAALPPPVTPTIRPGLQLPPPDPGHLGRVQDYLVRERGIAPALLEPLIQSASLYADARANAVFLLRGNQNVPVGAELRGTTSRPWRGLAPGSRKDLGFFSIPAAAPTDWPVVVCESAIDAISCFALHPCCHCLSSAGASPNPRWLAPLLARAAQVYCGFDADTTGENMAQAMIALHPAVQRLRPSLHDWNDVLRAGA